MVLGAIAGFSAVPGMASDESDQAPSSLVILKVQTDYHDSRLEAITKVAEALPPSREELHGGESISSFILRLYGFGPSNREVSGLYQYLQNSIARLNGIQDLERVRPGLLLVPSLPKRALTQPGAFWETRLPPVIEIELKIVEGAPEATPLERIFPPFRRSSDLAILMIRAEAEPALTKTIRGVSALPGAWTAALPPPPEDEGGADPPYVPTDWLRSPFDKQLLLEAPVETDTEIRVPSDLLSSRGSALGESISPSKEESQSNPGSTQVAAPEAARSATEEIDIAVEFGPKSRVHPVTEYSDGGRIEAAVPDLSFPSIERVVRISPPTVVASVGEPILGLDPEEEAPEDLAVGCCAPGDPAVINTQVLEFLAARCPKSPQREVVLLVHDDGWPTQAQASESLKLLKGMIDRVHRVNFGKGFRNKLLLPELADPLDFSFKRGEHASAIDGVLSELEAVCDSAVTIVFMPSRVATDPVTERLIGNLLRVVAAKSNFEDVVGEEELPEDVAAIYQGLVSAAVGTQIRAIREHSEGGADFPKPILWQAVWRLGQLWVDSFEKKTTAPLVLIVQSWDTSQRAEYVYAPVAHRHLLAVAAAGNRSRVAGGKQTWPAGRALLASRLDQVDTIAVLNASPAGPVRRCSKSLPIEAPLGRVVGLDGRAGSACGTSFSAPRMAWLLGFLAALDPDLEIPELLEKLGAVAGTEVTHTHIDVMRLLGSVD